jgi:hypothetical protein
MLRYVWSQSWLYWALLPGELAGALLVAWCGPWVNWGSVFTLMYLTLLLGLGTAATAALTYLPPLPKRLRKVWLVCPYCHFQGKRLEFARGRTANLHYYACPGCKREFDARPQEGAA